MSAREMTIVLLIVIGVILIVPVITMSVWGTQMMGPTAMMGGRSAGIVLLAMLGVAGVVAAILARRRSPDPVELLKQRLARGEISREQYEELRQLLQP